MNILILFEESGTIRDYAIDQGHYAISVDLKAGRGKHQECHDQIDVFEFLETTNVNFWDLVIAHPPCTYLCNSSVDHLDQLRNTERVKKLDAGALVFKRILNYGFKKLVVENPIPHGYAVERIGCSYHQIIHPWQHGHPEQKATCLWLVNSQKVQETNNVKQYMDMLPPQLSQRLFYLPPSPERAGLRSETYPGIGRALIDQLTQPDKQQSLF